MRIQALNVSLPEVVVYMGEEVLTGIYKVPTAEPLMVRKSNQQTCSQNPAVN